MKFKEVTFYFFVILIVGGLVITIVGNGIYLDKKSKDLCLRDIGFNVCNFKGLFYERIGPITFSDVFNGNIKIVCKEDNRSDDIKTYKFTKEEIKECGFRG